MALSAYPAFLSDEDVPTWIERHLPQVELTSAGESLPRSMRRLVRLGAFLADPDRIALFGSWARGDAIESSDYDLALFGIRRPDGFARLVHDAENEFVTLFAADLVDAERCGPALSEAIWREGVTLYERP